MAVALANPTVIINNLSVPVVPNSVMFTEGLGTQKVRVQSSGGGAVQSVVSNDVETNLSDFKLSIYPTADNIELIRGWKVNTGLNAISCTADGGFSRSISNATVVNDYEVKMGADTNIEVEFKGDAAI